MNVVFVAPYAMETTLRFARKVGELPGVRMGVISQEPGESLVRELGGCMQAFERVEDSLDPEQVHRAVLALIEPPDLPSFLYRLTHEVPRTLGLEEARLCLEADVDAVGPAESIGAGNLEADGDGRVLALPEGTVADYMALDGAAAEPVVLREAGSEAELIFGESNPVQSEALMRLDVAGSPGMLAFGSSDPRKFDPGSGKRPGRRSEFRRCCDYRCRLQSDCRGYVLGRHARLRGEPQLQQSFCH